MNNPKQRIQEQRPSQPDLLQEICELHHDLANYLNAVQGYAELASRSAAHDADAKIHGYLRSLLEASSSAVVLHERLGQLARCEAASGQFDLGEVMRHSVGIAVPCFAANVRLSVHIHQRPAPINGDALALQRLISNVVINAGQAMPLGGALQVVLDSHQVVDLLRTRARDLHPGRYLRVTVRDTGDGMDEQTLGRIFERGFTTRPGGSGLGLSSVLDTLERHGGGVIVNSWPGTGTEVNIYLPWAG